MVVAQQRMVIGMRHVGFPFKKYAEALLCEPRLLWHVTFFVEIFCCDSTDFNFRLKLLDVLGEFAWVFLSSAVSSLQYILTKLIAQTLQHKITIASTA
jgi:hypothetical protein